MTLRHLNLFHLGIKLIECTICRCIGWMPIYFISVLPASIMESDSWTGHSASQCPGLSQRKQCDSRFETDFDIKNEHEEPNGRDLPDVKCGIQNEGEVHEVKNVFLSYCSPKAINSGLSKKLKRLSPDVSIFISRKTI